MQTLLNIDHDIKLHSGQLDVWNSDARTKIVVAGRRWGKTELGVLDCIRTARSLDLAGKINPLIWYVVPTYRMARPVWDKFFELTPAGWITAHQGTRSHPDTIEMGRTRIEFKTAENPGSLVGVGLRKVYIDEAGVIRSDVWNESIRPALIDFKAPAFIYGTPKGRNWFYDIHLRGHDPAYPDTATFGGPSFQNPFLPEEEFAQLEREMYADLFRQEILAVFLEGEGTVFRNIRKLADASAKTFGGKGYCHHPTRWIGVDLARLVDFTVLFGICRQGHATGFDRFNQLSWRIQKQRIVAAWKESRAYERNVELVVDASGVGDDVVDDLDHLGASLIPVKTGPRKRELIEGYAMQLDEHALLLPNEPVLVNEHEAYTYEITKGGHVRYNAPPGLHDDTVIAAALAGWGLRHAREPLLISGGPI